jgi:hypothetical protein
MRSRVSCDSIRRFTSSFIMNIIIVLINWLFKIIMRAGDKKLMINLEWPKPAELKSIAIRHGCKEMLRVKFFSVTKILMDISSLHDLGR